MSLMVEVFGGHMQVAAENFNAVAPGQIASTREPLLFPVLLLIFSGTVTLAWVGFLVWLPLHWLDVL